MSSDTTTPPDTTIPPPPAPPPEAPAPGLKRTAAVNAIWTVAGFGVGQVLRFAANIVMARLLFPEAFGLVALASVFLMGLHLFADVGIRTSIIQHKRGDEPDFLNTAWTLQIIRGFLLFLASMVLAWPAAYLRETPEPLLFWVLIIMGSTAIIEGFNSTAIVTLSRRLQPARRVLLELGTQVASLSVMIGWAWTSPTVWALVAGSVVSPLVTMLLSHVVIPGFRNRLHWDREAVHDLMHFGKWIYISTACTFLAGQADRLVVGFQSLALLGVYHFATQLAQIPAQLMSAFAGQLVFPLYSRLHQSGRDIKEFFNRIHLVGAGFASLLIAGVIATGQSVVQCLYDQRYQGAAWMLPLLAIGVWFQVLESLEGSILWALGRSRPSAISNAGKVLALFVAVPVGYHLAEIPGMVLGFVVGDFVRYILTVYFLRLDGLNVLRYDVAMSLFIIGASFAGIAAADWLRPYPLRAELLAALAVTPDSHWPGTIPWAGLKASYTKDYSTMFIRLLVEGGVVTGLWSLAALACWRAGLLKKPTA